MQYNELAVYVTVTNELLMEMLGVVFLLLV